MLAVSEAAQLETQPDPTNVVNCCPERQQQLAKLLKPYGIEINFVAENEISSLKNKISSLQTKFRC